MHVRKAHWLRNEPKKGEKLGIIGSETSDELTDQCERHE